MAMLTLIIAASSAFAQVAEDKTEVAPDQVRFGEPSTIRFRVGVEVTASRGAAREMRLFVAVPFECPEQEVKSVDEDFSSEVGSVDYRMVQGGARQMLVSIPRLGRRRQGARDRHVRSHDAADPAAGKDRRPEDSRASAGRRSPVSRRQPLYRGAKPRDQGAGEGGHVGRRIDGHRLAKGRGALRLGSRPHRIRRRRRQNRAGNAARQAGRLRRSERTVHRALRG